VVGSIRRKSRSKRRSTQILSEEKDRAKEPALEKEKKTLLSTSVRDTRTGKFVSAQSCSGSYAKGKGVKDRFPKRRKGPSEPTIEETLRPVPDCLEEIEDAPTMQSAASALEWLEDIETIRGRSSYQGVLSRRIKERVAALRKVLEVIAVRVEEKGDIECLKRRNQELQGQLLNSQREIKRMDKRISDLQKTIGDLRSMIINDEGIRKMDKATSPMKSMAVKSYQKMETDEPVEEDFPPAIRPPIKGVSKIIPEGRNSFTKGQNMREDALLSQQIVELVSRRKLIRERLEGSPKTRSPIDTRKKGPKIISNIQLVPPKKPAEIDQVGLAQTTDQKREQKMVPGSATLEGSSEWIQVMSHGRRKKENKKQKLANQASGTGGNSQDKAGDLKKNPWGNDKAKPQGIRRRPPRTAAVAIKGLEANFSYAEALKRLREQISLPELVIDKSHVMSRGNSD